MQFAGRSRIPAPKGMKKKVDLFNQEFKDICLRFLKKILSYCLKYENINHQ
jgi:hypothetical protein